MKSPRDLLVISVWVAGLGCAHPSSQGSSRSPSVAVLARVEETMIAAVIDSIAAHWEDSTAVCVTLMGGPEGARPAPDDLLHRLQTRQQAVRGDQCPRTYTSMVLVVDSAGRPTAPPAPAGYVDPYQLTVSRPQFQQPGYAWIYVREQQGTLGNAYMCVAQAYERVYASCRSIESWVN